jgi:hypothetical protein
MRRQPKDLGELCELDGEPLAIGHPNKDSIFLVKVESGVELRDDLLVPVVTEQQQVSDAMELM